MLRNITSIIFGTILGMSAMMISLIFTYTGWENLNFIPHPDWFIVDLLFYVPAAYLGFYLIFKKS